MLDIRQLQIHLNNQALFKPLDLCIEKGQVLTLMGASGVGKSTLLNWLIGALPEAFKASGEIHLNGQRIDALATEQRAIGILFQDDLLFAHMNVGDNLAFALPATVVGQQRQAQIQQSLAKAGLEGFYDRDPATLSGGQRARVSVLRALMAQPQALLLDEPFSRLDKALRQQFREFVYAQIGELNIPALLVTHDEDDAPAEATIIQLEPDTHA